MTEITAHHGIFRDTQLQVDDTGGSERPVVLIHGWPLSGEAWKDQVPVLSSAGRPTSGPRWPAWRPFGTTDFRADLLMVTVPILVLHGDADGTVPFERSGKRTHAAIAGSELHLIAGGPHGCNVSHADEWNRVLIEFLSR